jgi:ubiquitin-like protein ATG12
MIQIFQRMKNTFRVILIEYIIFHLKFFKICSFSSYQDEKLTKELDHKLALTPTTSDTPTNNQLDSTTSHSNQIDQTPNINNASDSSINTATNTPTSAPASTTPNKIEILLKAVGNAPILKNRKFLLERTKNVHYILGWLKKYMKLDPKDQLFLYVNQEFAPSPDAEIGTIYDCFKIGNTVIFHYCITPAWG